MNEHGGHVALPVRRILLVDDDPDDALIVRELLAESTPTRFELEWVATFDSALQAIAQDRHDAYLVDYNLGQHYGTALLAEAVRLGVRGPVIMLTGLNSAVADGEAERMGASDYLLKGRIDAMLLERAIRYAIGRKQGELRQRFLSDTARMLSSSLDLDESLHAVARLAVPQLGDFSLVYYADPEDGEARLVGAHSDPSQAHLLGVLERTYRPDPDNPNSVICRVRRTGVTARTDEIPDAALAALAQSTEQLHVFRALGGRAGLAVPLIARGETRGALVLNRTTPGAVYTDDEQALAEEFARHAALTVDNASLYRRAQRATTLRDEVLAVVSHDLRNPVGTVMMSASFVLDVLSPETLDEQVRQQLIVIRRATTRMRRLIDDLLDVTRIEAGRLSLTVAPTTLDSVMKEFCEGFDPQTTMSGQRLVCDLPPELPPVAADRERLLQVLGNLVGNALKFAPGNSPIRIAARRVNAEVHVAVSDSGPGINPEDLPYLFRRFWQKHSGSRTGAGLGLAITKAIVEGHCGRIWVESRPGEDATFLYAIPVWVLPLVADRASQIEAPAVAASGFARRDARQGGPKEQPSS